MYVKYICVGTCVRADDVSTLMCVCRCKGVSRYVKYVDASYVRSVQRYELAAKVLRGVKALSNSWLCLRALLAGCVLSQRVLLNVDTL